MVAQAVFTHSCIVAMGSNLRSMYGDPTQTIVYALKNMVSSGFELRRVSRFYNTPAFPDPSDPPFVNACVEIRTDQSPQEVLLRLHAIEAGADRIRETRWAARSLDLDLISYDDQVLPNPQVYESWATLAVDEQQRRAPTELILPHPRIADRAFVLVPLLDIAPQWCHPVTGQTCLEMVKNLDKSLIDEVKPL